MKIRHDVMASGNILVPKSRSRSGHEKDTCELSCQKIRKPSGKGRTQERYKEQWDGSHWRGASLSVRVWQCSDVELFHVFKFHCSMVTTNFLLDKNFLIYSTALQIVSTLCTDRHLCLIDMQRIVC